MQQTVLSIGTMVFVRWGLPITLAGTYAALVALGAGAHAAPETRAAAPVEPNGRPAPPARPSSRSPTPAASPPRPASRATRQPLFEGPRERADRLRTAREAALAGTLSELPGVAAARVHLAPPTRTALDRPASETRAVAVLRLRGQPAAPAQIRDWSTRILIGAVPNLVDRAVDVVLIPKTATQPPPEASASAHVGPFDVAAGSAGPLRALLTALFALNAVLAGALVWLWRRRG